MSDYAETLISDFLEHVNTYVGCDNFVVSPKAIETIRKMQEHIRSKKEKKNVGKSGRLFENPSLLIEEKEE